MNIVVVGASAAGLKAACRARRLLAGATVTVLDEGQYVSYAGCGMPYYLSGDVDEARQLMMTSYDVEKTPEYFLKTKGVQVLTGVRAVRIDIPGKWVDTLDLATGETREYPCDELIIATGAAPSKPSIPGIDSPGVFSFTRLEDIIKLRQALNKNEVEKVAIIGAGYIGCELCESFKALWGIETVLLEQKEQILPQLLDIEMAQVAALELKRQGIKVHTDVNITKIQAEGNKLTVITDNTPGEFKGFDRIVYAAGVQPRTELAKQAGINTGFNGGIVVDAQMRTNLPQVYAVGDCVLSNHVVTGKPFYLPLGSSANRMGRVAANTIAGIKDSFGQVCGSSCLKLFDLNVAATGLTAQAALEEGYSILESWGVFTDKAHYYPEHKLISAKIVFEVESLRILGIQAVGFGEVIGIIDIITEHLKRKATLKELWDLEHAYSPPYANALHPVHFLAYAGVAQAHRKLKAVNPVQVEAAALNSTVLDVREEIEIKEKPFIYQCRKLLTVPFPQIRERLNEIPAEHPILVVCQRGTRSAETVRILIEAGFQKVSYAGGGLGFFLES